jgi:hypothetical protein
MAKLGVLLFILICGLGVVYRQLSSLDFQLVGIESYAGSDDHIILTVYHHGRLFGKERKFITDETRDSWWEFDQTQRKRCNKEVEKVLRKIYFANKDRLGFDEVYPTAHLGT